MKLNSKLEVIADINTNAADYNFNDYELITSGDDYEEGVEKYYKKIKTTSKSGGFLL